MSLKLVPRAYDSYRPNTFGQLVGNTSVLSRLTRMIANDVMPNVLFLTGPTGSGKTTLARVIARALLCKGRKDREFEPCGACSSCGDTIGDYRGDHWDYDERCSNRVNHEYMDEDLPILLRNPSRVTFLDEIQDLSPENMRLLRKVIEGATGTLILATTHPDLIEDAVRNRLKSYEYNLQRPTTDEVVEFLAIKCKELGVTYSSKKDLARVCEFYKCEMRPCAEFPHKALRENGKKLTPDYLDEIFGTRQVASNAKRYSRKPI